MTLQTQTDAMTAQQASLAWQHAHPLLLIAYSTLGALVIISVIVLLRWLFSRPAWKYHPGGGAGFLRDEIGRWGAILVPWLALSIGFKFYVYDLHPEYNKPGVWVGFIVCAIAFRLILRRLPPIKAMGRHIDAARARARAARLGA